MCLSDAFLSFSGNVLSQAMMSQKTVVHALFFWIMSWLSSGNEVAGRSVSDHDSQADHTRCVFDITRKQYMHILDGVCCGDLR